VTFLFLQRKVVKCAEVPLRLYLNQFSQPEDGGTIILQNVGTLYHYRVPKPKNGPVFE
jgi:hypothetical protein